jgi:hypothetical protein
MHFVDGAMLLKELTKIILTCRESNIANEDIHALFLIGAYSSPHQHARAVYSNGGDYSLQRPSSSDHPGDYQSIVAEDAGAGKMKPLWLLEILRTSLSARCLDP